MALQKTLKPKKFKMKQPPVMPERWCRQQEIDTGISFPCDLAYFIDKLHELGINYNNVKVDYSSSECHDYYCYGHGDELKFTALVEEPEKDFNARMKQYKNALMVHELWEEQHVEEIQEYHRQQEEKTLRALLKEQDAVRQRIQHLEDKKAGVHKQIDREIKKLKKSLKEPT